VHAHEVQGHRGLQPLEHLLWRDPTSLESSATHTVRWVEEHALRPANGTKREDSFRGAVPTKVWVAVHAAPTRLSLSTSGATPQAAEAPGGGQEESLWVERYTARWCVHVGSWESFPAAVLRGCAGCARLLTRGELSVG
jgi:hypothetical protein